MKRRHFNWSKISNPSNENAAFGHINNKVSYFFARHRISCKPLIEANAMEYTAIMRFSLSGGLLNGNYVIYSFISDHMARFSTARINCNTRERRLSGGWLFGRPVIQQRYCPSEFCHQEIPTDFSVSNLYLCHLQQFFSS